MSSQQTIILAITAVAFVVLTRFIYTGRPASDPAMRCPPASFAVQLAAMLAIAFAIFRSDSDDVIGRILGIALLIALPANLIAIYHRLYRRLLAVSKTEADAPEISTTRDR